MPISSNIERFQLKLKPKAQEAFVQISRTAQERLENDQLKVNPLLIRFDLFGEFLSDEKCATSIENRWSIDERGRENQTPKGTTSDYLKSYSQSYCFFDCLAESCWTKFRSEFKYTNNAK